MELSTTIDWLSVTFHDQSKGYSIVTMLEPSNTSEIIKPKFGYDFGMKYASGLMFFASNTRQDMGIHIIMSGSTLKYYQEANWDVLSILEKFVTNGGKVTRLDLALDLIDGGINGEEIYKASQDVAEHTGSAISHSMVLSALGGCTFYAGSRQSDRFMRVYNKGVESNVGGDWWRMEVECKGDVAKEYSRVVAMQNGVELGGFTWSIARAIFHTERGSYPMFGLKHAVVGLPKIEKSSDTRKWLIEQCIPALEKWLEEHCEDTQVMQALIDLWEKVGKSGKKEIDKPKP